MSHIQGWRHFRISGRRYQDGLLMIELMAACDRSVRFEIEASRLGDLQAFAPGWTSLQPTTPET